MKKVKAVFFDLDGTLVDSEHFHYECWQEMLENYGIHITFDQWIKDSAGIALPANAARLVRDYHLNISPEELVQKRLGITEVNVKERGVSPMPYATEFVQSLAAKGIRLTLVTSSLRPEVDVVFETSPLREYFDHVITRDDVEKGKPDPEPYLKAWQLYPEFEKEECLIFEDTITGVTAAVSSGIPCFAIQQIAELQDRLKIAEKVFSNLEEASDYLQSHNLI